MEGWLECRSPRGEESLQMWGLNKRLEAYLARVKSLEEENGGLQAELRRLKEGGPPEGTWRARCGEQVAALRAALDDAFRDKHAAELARAGLDEEVQQVKSRCQKERAAREEAKRLLALGKQQLAEEQRSHLWLRQAAAQLQKEADALLEDHRQERARLEQEAAGLSWTLGGGARGAPAAFQPVPEVEEEDYAEGRSGIWRGAVEAYKAEVAQLEASFGQAKQSLWQAAQSNRQSQVRLQHLQRELAGLQARKETLQERLAQQGQRRQGEARKLQLAVEGLEEEKRALTTQIAHVLEDRRQLMHLKMSLSLEVATYRTLLEAESMRLQMPADHLKLALSPHDSKSEASSRKRQGASLERGARGSPRDPKLSSTTFLKGGVTPQSTKNQNGSFVVSMASVLPKGGRSLVAREFQKASMALHPKTAKASEQEEVPVFIGSTAFLLDSSLQNDVVAAVEAGPLAQPFTRESPPLSNSTASEVSGESSPNAGQSHCPGGDGGETAAQIKREELGKKAELHEEVEEGEEPPGKAPSHCGPDPSSPLVVEALQTVLRKDPWGEVCFEAGFLNPAEAPNDIPFNESLAVEEENRAGISPSSAALGQATLELHKSQTEESRSADLPEAVNVSEEPSEVHSGPGAGVWPSPDAEPRSLQEMELSEEERSPSAQQNKEDVVFDIPAIEGFDHCSKMSASEQPEGGVWGLAHRGGLEHDSSGPRSARPLGMGTAAMLGGDQDSSEPGPSDPEDHTAGATGADVEEADRGGEDLEVGSTEAVHLSEDEERTALSSPSRDSEEPDFQAEVLEHEFLQAEEFAAETLSPISHSFYSAEDCQEHHFLGVQEETPEEQMPFSTSDATFPEEEGKELGLEPEATSTEGREGHSSNTLSAEPRATEEAGAEEGHTWEPQQDTMGHQGGLLEEEDLLGEENKEMAILQDGTREQETVLQKENVESVPTKEISKGEQGEEIVDVCQEDLPSQQQMEEEEITTKGEQGDETIEVRQEYLPMGQRMEEEAIATKEQQKEETVEACQGGPSVEQQMAEEEIATKGEQEEETLEICQEDLSAEQQTEEEEITTKGEQGEERVEVCQEYLPMGQRMEEEEIATKGQQKEETVEACQGGPSVEQQISEEEIATKGEEEEETAEVCEEDLLSQQQMEEEETATKGEQREEIVEVCQEDLSADQQTEEEEITTKGEQGEETVEVCQEYLPVEDRMEEKAIATKEQQKEETVEACQGGPSVEQQMAEEEIATKREQEEETLEMCQEDLSVEQQTEEEEITTKGEQGEERVEVCQEYLPMGQRMEEEEIATKGQQKEETVEACQGGPSVEQQIAEEEIATKGEEEEETAEVCEEDLPSQQRMKEEEITTKGKQGEETVEVCQEDLSAEQQMDEEEITTKGEQRGETLEMCQEDLSVKQQVVEEEITTEGEQGEATVEACQEYLPMEQRMVEEEISPKGQQKEESVEACQGGPSVEQEEETTMASPESAVLKGEVLITGSEDVETEEMEAKTSLVEKEETVGPTKMNDLWEKENSEVRCVFETETPPEEEQPVSAEGEDTHQNQHSPSHEISTVALDMRNDTTRGFKGESSSCPQDVDLSSESDRPLQSYYSGSEVSLESFEVSPNSTCETEGIERELESGKRIKLEDTLPDNTPLHVYDEKMLLVAGKGQVLPENEEAAAETSPLTEDSVSLAEATEPAAEAKCPRSSQTENDGAQGLEAVDEERDSACRQNSSDSEELPISKDLEEAKTETLELIRNHEEDLHFWEAQRPNTEAPFPPFDAEFDEQPQGTLKGGRGATEELWCGEMTQEETRRTDFVWETEGDSLFQADQPGSSHCQEYVQEGCDSPLEFRDPNNIGSEGSHEVSPLTSVADLGEIVLEGEQSPDDLQKDTAESDGLVFYEDRSWSGTHESQPVCDLEGCGREDLAQPTYVAETDSGSLDSTDPPPKAEGSLPTDSLKASDILEIVEQALEFNQELIKAAGQTVEVEQPATHEEVRPSPESESKGSPLAMPDVGRSQIFTETPRAPSPSAKDPTGSGRLWLENHSSGLQADPTLPDFAADMLNGIGDLRYSDNCVNEDGSSRHELSEEVAVSRRFNTEDLDDLSAQDDMNQNPPQTLVREEAPRTEETSSETLKNVSVEGLNADKSFFANIMQSAHVKGKEAEMEAVSFPPRFGEEILHPESSQHLKFHPEDAEELWSPKDN